ncbi:hypothetical protein [Oleiagrimonas sp. C23AA]|uniref:hypothetical protein n=1 Tax=Oleiagrimonas sp. C23AA TaxID=2719047 RepID=UPI0014245ACE|nr:hypothetical protein [Oleiagrimonas sp. C23AA]NII10007.1 hypothetical protein [Oleiagrimonas sp. C23AA]
MSLGPGPFNRTARLMLYQMRWRQSPPEYGLRASAVCLSILIHFAVLVAMLLRPVPGVEPAPNHADDAIEVRLVKGQPPPPPPPPKLRLPRRVQQAAQTHRARAPKHGAMTLPPLPKVTLAAPETRPSAERPTPPATPRLAAARPQPAPQQAPPAEQDSPVPKARPAPPRVVLEHSPMALTPPKVALEQVSVAATPAPDAMDTPIDVSGDAPVVAAPSQAPASAADLTSARATPLPSVPQVPPAPAIEAVPVDQPAPPQADLSMPASPPQVSQEPVQAPRIAAPSVPQPSLPATPQMAAPRAALQAADVPRGAPALPDATPGSLQLPTVSVTMPSPAPSRAPGEMALPAREAAAADVAGSAASDSKNWAQSSASDRFAIRTPGQGLKGLPGQGGDASRSSGHREGKADYVQLQPQGNSDVMSRRTSRVHYRPTRFEQYWVPYGQSALDTALGRLLDKLTVVKEIRLPRGYRVRCALGVSIALLMSCGGEPPAAAPAESDDPRLNMAPAALVKGMAAPASSAPPAPLPKVNTVPCEVARVAGGPPPPGCPDVKTVAPDQSDVWTSKSNATDSQ